MFWILLGIVPWIVAAILLISLLWDILCEVFDCIWDLISCLFSSDD